MIKNRDEPLLSILGHAQSAFLNASTTPQGRELLSSMMSEKRLQIAVVRGSSEPLYFNPTETLLCLGNVEAIELLPPDTGAPEDAGRTATSKYPKMVLVTVALCTVLPQASGPTLMRIVYFPTLVWV
jgi:hypothetical protein